MNIFNITGTQGPRGPEEKGGTDRSGAASREDAPGKTERSKDSFAQSDRAGEVQSLVDALQADSGLRAELVDKFKALMDLGQLDTPESADRAAAAILATAPEAPSA